ATATESYMENIRDIPRTARDDKRLRKLQATDTGVHLDRSPRRSGRSLPFASVRSTRPACGLYVGASERDRTRAKAEPCPFCHGVTRPNYGPFVRFPDWSAAAAYATFLRIDA